jgi:ribose transport system substrate-binding protein
VMMRTKGFREVIGEKSNLRIVKTLPGGGAREVSFKATQDLLQGTSDLNGIFAINDPSGKGAAAALENAQRAGEIQIVAFDAMPEGRQAVKDGEFYATIVQYPDKIGRTVVQQIVQYLEGEPVPKEVLIPCTIYRKAEADADPTLP